MIKNGRAWVAQAHLSNSFVRASKKQKAPVETGALERGRRTVRLLEMRQAPMMPCEAGALKASNQL
ncbi:MAG: hypothetical protein EA353_10860 [Puniceicoccaceae bacterium]|nr:MAG: hypothetical protein EA353_10860 [Puniceicoccaceae bacterium]